MGVVPVNLATAFPPFGLRIEAGPLVLRPITDDMLPELIDLALAGIHDPQMMPFYVPWTDAPPDRLPRDFTLYHWLFAGQCGIDPYSAASSEVYQDLFGAGSFTGKLANEGDKIVLQLPEPWLAAIQIFTYQGWWYAQADGGGGSLEIQDALANRIQWDERNAWRASGVNGGSPGGQFAVPDFATWLAAWQLTDPVGDADHDGLSEVAEYALGYLPVSTMPEGGPLGGLTGTGQLQLAFSLPAFAPPDVTYQVQTSGELTSGSWTTIAQRSGNAPWTGAAMVETGAPSGGRVSLVVTEPPPTIVPLRRFIRLRFTVP